MATKGRNPETCHKEILAKYPSRLAVNENFKELADTNFSPEFRYSFIKLNFLYWNKTHTSVGQSYISFSGPKGEIHRITLIMRPKVARGLLIWRSRKHYASGKVLLRVQVWKGKAPQRLRVSFLLSVRDLCLGPMQSILNINSFVIIKKLQLQNHNLRSVRNHLSLSWIPQVLPQLSRTTLNQ